MTELDPTRYTVVWIAPLEIEARAAWLMLDHQHKGNFPMSRGDDYVFHAGDINKHNVVVATLPPGREYGSSSAAALASQVKKFFPNLWFGLLVGVAAGLPNFSRRPPRDIRLGDVLVALPEGESAELIAYDLGKETKDGFQLLSFGHVLAKTEDVVRSAIGRVKLKALDDPNLFLHFYQSIKNKNHSDGTFIDPGQDKDRLYQGHDDDTEILVQRQQRPESERTRVWYGPIGSGEKLVKNSKKRDEFRDKYNIIGLEMEAAGTINRIPVGVIRGVCDYGDEHKNKEWQPYAAAMAAAYAKAVLYEILPKDTHNQVSTAHERPIDLTEKDNQCLADLLLTNPADDLRRIEDIKGGLLNDSFCWILESSEFKQWFNGDESQLLWVNGDAGKGKTMLMIGVIKELLSRVSRPRSSVSYFLCQGTDSRLNNATAILRGIIYLLVKQQSLLISHLREEYDSRGRKLFEDTNAFYSLSNILQHMLEDSRLVTLYLVVDALDECERGLQSFLNFIIQTATIKSSQIKWIVSSRNRNDIEQCLKPANPHARLSLELNADHISHAVNAYIDHKLSRLPSLEHNHVLRKQVRDQMRQKSDGTFLCIALVIEELQRIAISKDILQVLQRIPTGLIPLYNRMMGQILQDHPNNIEHCRCILSVATLAYRPLHLLEMCVASGLQDEVMNSDDLKTIIRTCGSFLTIRKEYVYFIHQSAKDYLIVNASSIVFSCGRNRVHYDIFSRSLDAMSKELKQNIYKLKDWGPLTEIVRPDPDPLVSIRYCCEYWLDHLFEVDCPTLEYSHDLNDNGRIFDFFKVHFLHWLESLSLIHAISGVLLIIRKLLDRIESTSSIKFATYLKDAERFILSYQSILRQAPLQTYSAALIFCPRRSEMKIRYWSKKLDCIQEIRGNPRNWDPCLQTLEHQADVHKVTFSPDGRTLASGSYHYIWLWDITTGACTQTIKDLKAMPLAISFLLDGRTLISALEDGTIGFWDTIRQEWKQINENYKRRVLAAAFFNGHILALVSSSCIHLWDVASETCTYTFEGNFRYVRAVNFFPDGKNLVLLEYNEIKFLDVATGVCMKIYRNNGFLLNQLLINAIIFSPDGKILVPILANNSIRLLDVGSSAQKFVWTFKEHNNKVQTDSFPCIRNFKGHTGEVKTIVLSPDGKTLASGSQDCTIRLWNMATEACIQILRGHSDCVHEIAFSSDSKMLVSSSANRTVRLWEASIQDQKQTENHTNVVNRLILSPDGQILASILHNGSIHLWNTRTGTCMKTIDDWRYINKIVFSPDGRTLAILTDHELWLWDIIRWACRQVLSYTDNPQGMVFSPDGLILVSVFEYATKLVHTITGDEIRTIKSYSDHPKVISFHPDGQRLALGSSIVIKLWDIRKGKFTQAIEWHYAKPKAICFSPDGQTLASASDQGIQFWDLKTGTHIQTLIETCGDLGIDSLSFAANGQYLRTNRGLLAIHPGSSENSRDQNPVNRIFIIEDWVTRNGKKILWLPPDYRVAPPAVLDNTVALAQASGQIVFLKFTP